MSPIDTNHFSTNPPESNNVKTPATPAVIPRILFEFYQAQFPGDLIAPRLAGVATEPVWGQSAVDEALSGTEYKGDSFAAIANGAIKFRSVEPLEPKHSNAGRYKLLCPGKSKYLNKPGKGTARPFIAPVPVAIAERVANTSGLALPEDARDNESGFWGGFHPWANENKLPILLVEGEQPALALLTQGFYTIGLGGIWMGVRDKELHRDLAAFDLEGRIVMPFFDYEPNERKLKTQRSAIGRLGYHLNKAGALVKIPEMKPDVDTLKEAKTKNRKAPSGQDDFIRAGQIEVVTNAIENAIDWKAFQKRLFASGAKKYREFTRTPRFHGNARFLTQLVTPEESTVIFEELEGKGTAMLLSVKSELGTGKTEFLKLFKAQRPDLSFLNIAHRVTLAGNLSNRLGATLYGDGVDYTHVRELTISVDSLWKLVNREESFDIVAIDEIVQVLHHLKESSTCRKDLHRITNVFEEIIHKAKLVIILDAHLNDIATDEILSMMKDGTQEVSIVNEAKVEKRTVYKYNKREQLIAAFMLAVREGKKIYVASNSKTKVKALARKCADVGILKKYQCKDVERWADGLNEGDDSKEYKPKICAVHGENSGSPEKQQVIRKFGDAVLKFDIFLGSPTISTGLDCSKTHTEHHFDACFALFECTNQPSTELIQQIWRIRHPIDTHIWVDDFPRRGFKETSAKVIKQQILDNDKLNTYLVRYDREKQERVCIREAELEYTARLKAARNANINNLREDTFALLEEMGMDIIPVTKGSAIDLAATAKGDYKETREAIKIEDATAVCEAERIDEATAKIRRDLDYLPPTEQAELDRYEIESFYRLNEEQLSVDTVVFDDNGRLRSKIRALEDVLASLVFEEDEPIEVDRTATEETEGETPTGRQMPEWLTSKGCAERNAAAAKALGITDSFTPYDSKDGLEIFPLLAEAIVQNEARDLETRPHLLQSRFRAARISAADALGLRDLVRHFLHGGIVDQKDPRQAEILETSKKNPSLVKLLKQDGTRLKFPETPYCFIKDLLKDVYGIPLTRQRKRVAGKRTYQYKLDKEDEQLQFIIDAMVRRNAFAELKSKYFSIKATPPPEVERQTIIWDGSGSQDKFDAIAGEFRSASAIAFDLETFGNPVTTGKRKKVTKINNDGLNHHKGHIRLMQLSTPNVDLIIDLGGRDEDREERAKACQPMTDLVQELLANPHTVVAGHNIHFDLRFMATKYDFVGGVNIWDTMLGVQVYLGNYGGSKKKAVLDGGYSLKNCASRFLGAEVDKTEQTSDWGAALTQSQLDYAAQDSQVTLQLFDAVKNLYHDGSNTLNHEGLYRAWKLECDFLTPLVKTELTGMGVDMEELERQLTELENCVKPLMKEWDSLCPNIKPTQSKALKEYLNGQGLHLAKMDKATVAQYPDNRLLQIRSELTAIKTYKDRLLSFKHSAIEHGGRVKTQYRSLTGTGRTSSGGGNTLKTTPNPDRFPGWGEKKLAEFPNLQSISSKQNPAIKAFGLANPRKCIVPGDGRGMAVIDLAAAHARIAADKSGDEIAIAGMNDDSIDNHSRVAAFVAQALGYEWDWQKIATLRKQDTPDGRRAKLFRETAKNTFYGFLNGAGALRVQEQIAANSGEIVDIEAVKLAVKGCEDLYPRLTAYKRELTTTIEKNQMVVEGKTVYVNNQCGDSHILLLANDQGRIPYTQALASTWSRIEATAIKRAFIDAWKLSDLRPEWKLKVTNIVHDELDIEYDKAYEAEVVPSINKIVGDHFQSMLENVSDGRTEDWTKLVADNWSEK